MAVEISVLGPLAATVDGRPVALGSPQQRALLALLALRAPSLVQAGTIVDVLWDDEPPPSATKVVQTYVSRLRRELGDDVIRRQGRGYRLALPASALDRSRFQELAAAGDFAAALQLWRGPALADVRDVAGLRAEAEQLDEARTQAIEDRIDADLAAGRDGAALAAARALVVSEPLRERPVAQLMLALYRSGRQAEALAVYRDARRRLVDDLGIEPGEALKALERRILGQDPSLERSEHKEPPAAGAPVVRRRRSVLRLLAAGALVAAIGVAAAHGFNRGHKQVTVRDNSIVRIDPRTNRIVDDIPVGRGPAGLIATADGIWVADEQDKTLAFVDPASRDVQTIGGVTDISFLAHDAAGTIYASGWDHPTVWRIDPKKRVVLGHFDVRSRALALTIGGGSLWVADRLVNSVTRYDLARRRVAGVTRVGLDPLVQTFGFGALWTAGSDDATVSVIRPGVAKPDTIRVDPKPFGIAAGLGAVWVGSNDTSRVIRIDPETHQIRARILVAASRGLFSDLYSVRVGAGAVWAAARGDSSIVRIDPHTNRVAARIPLLVPPHDITVHGDQVWVSVSSYEG